MFKINILPKLDVSIGKKFDIVIARYKEDIEWIEKYESHINNIYIYNKGSLTYNPTKYKNIPLDNIGNESHTYLHHIITNYDNLNSVTIFVQGKFDDHLNNIEQLFTTNSSILFNEYIISYHFRLSFYKRALIPNKENLFFGDWLLKHTGYNCLNKKVKASWGACFSITKDKILSRPKEYYENLIKELDVNDSEVGHFFERSWFYIFNLHLPQEIGFKII